MYLVGKLYSKSATVNTPKVAKDLVSASPTAGRSLTLVPRFMELLSKISALVISVLIKKPALQAGL